MEDSELAMLAETVHKSLASSPTPDVDGVLSGLGWPEMLDEFPREATALVFRLMGESGTHAAVINDVVLQAAGRPIGGTVPLPFAGGRWVLWERTGAPADSVDDEIGLHAVDSGGVLPEAAVAAGRRAIAWWLVGSSRAMLALARRHALDRTQFGRPIASFQAVRHKLAETLIAIEGAAATLDASADDFGALLAKAAAGQAALTAARHCQQVMGGIGFTAEHDLHRHITRVMVLDGLLGSARELTGQAGAVVRSRGSAPRLAGLSKERT